MDDQAFQCRMLDYMQANSQEHTAILIEVATLKERARVWGAIAGLGAGAIGAVVMQLVLKHLGA